MKGSVSLGRFGRLSDLINASRGYIRVRDAQLLQRNGEPTNLILPELMVDQDEISFIAQQQAQPPSRAPRSASSSRSSARTSKRARLANS